MIYYTLYLSPIGEITIVSDENYILGIWFKNQKYFLNGYKNKTVINKKTKIIVKVINWLDLYFNGKNPSINSINLAPLGTAFQKEVWEILTRIPYGKVTTYGNIAKLLSSSSSSMLARAVGNAVSKNPISIIIPCHRVLGSENKLTGYAGGLDRKKYLLNLEGINFS